MSKPPFPFSDTRWPNADRDPEAQATWELIWEHKDKLLDYIRAGRGAAAALPADKLRALCPTTPREARIFLTRTGAQVAAFATPHGYKASSKKQRVYGSVFKRVACFEPIEQSASNPLTEEDSTAALQKRLEALETLVKQLCRRLGILPEELLAGA